MHYSTTDNWVTVGEPQMYHTAMPCCKIHTGMCIGLDNFKVKHDIVLHQSQGCFSLAL